MAEKILLVISLILLTIATVLNIIKITKQQEAKTKTIVKAYCIFTPSRKRKTRRNRYKSLKTTKTL